MICAQASKLPPAIGDFERFILHSKSARHLKIDHQAPASFENIYQSLFPTRPCFPQLRSLIYSAPPNYGLIRLLHPGIISLQIDRDVGDGSESVQETELITCSIQARTPNLIRFRDMATIPYRDKYSIAPAGTPFEKSVDGILHKWTHLRHLELVRLLPDFPIVFTAISQLYDLEYLKLVIARAEPNVAPIITGVEHSQNVSHGASKLEIEGDIADLHLGLALCSPGTRLTRISLLFYLNGSWTYRDRQDYLILPQKLSLVSITEVTVDVQDGEGFRRNFPPKWQLPSSAIFTLTTSEYNLVKLHIRLQCCVAITQPLLNSVVQSSPHLEHFVILRSVIQNDRLFYFPVVTLEDALQFALALPKLHHLGLDMDARLESHVIDSLAHLDNTIKLMKSCLDTLEVGASPIDDAVSVGNRLQRYLPLLRNLGWENGRKTAREEDCPWTRKFGSQWQKVNDLLEL